MTLFTGNRQANFVLLNGGLLSVFSFNLIFFMRVFVTGATGFVGSAVVKDLIAAGHEVLGLSRSDAGAKQLRDAGAGVHRGDIYDLDSIRSGASDVDGVIHTAFDHDFSRFVKNCETDRKVIECLGTALGTSGRPLVITSALAVLKNGEVSTENDRPVVDSSVMPRVASEEAAEVQVHAGVNVSVVRLPPSVHDAGDHGFVPMLIGIARDKGMSAYIGEGLNRWPAVHRADAAKLYRLALERGVADSRYHAVGDAGVPFREIATLIGGQLGLPVTSISAEEAAAHFGWFVKFAGIDVPSSAWQTSSQLGWSPSQPGLLADMVGSDYFLTSVHQS